MATTLTFSDSAGDMEPGHSTTDPIPQAAHRIAATADRFWHHSAPRIVVETFGRDGDSAGWRAWSRYLEKRPRQLLKLTSRDQSPLAWGIADEAVASGLVQFVERLDQLCRQGQDAQPRDRRWLERWLSDAAGAAVSLPYAFECLALGYALPRLTLAASAETWWDLVGHLGDAAMQAAASDLASMADPEAIVSQQLLAGELALVLASQFPEIEPLRGLSDVARNAFSEAIVELLDGKGLPRANQLPVSRLLLACWTRSRALSHKCKRRPWSAEAEIQYEWFVREALRFTRADGSLILSEPTQREWSPQLFRWALRLAGDEADRVFARQLLPGKFAAKAVPKKCRLPKAAVHSEWSGLALMAAEWSRSKPRLAVDYSGAELQIDLECHERLFCTGAWTFEATCDGQRLEIEGPWDKQCWFNNKACIYLELAILLSQGMRLERQILLARNEPVLYLADVLLTESDLPRQLQLASRLPLAADATFVPEAETFDGTVASGTAQAAAFPLSLPEWRVGSRGGGFAAEGTSLALHQDSVGSALCSAMFFDFKTSRIKKQRTWRQLTVVESLVAQPRDVAVGYRVQSGKDQWLAYRSFGPPRNRTVLGQNFSSEFFLGKFQPSGKAKKYLEIESA